MRSAFKLIFVAIVASFPLPCRGDFFEGFDDITTLPAAGWTLINNSAPVGIENWFQELPADIEFPAQDGPSNSYIGANFDSTSRTGRTNTISNWLIAPTQAFNNGDTISFFTRKAANSTFPDRLEVRLSFNGTSSDIGASASSVGDFTTLMHDINPSLTLAGYPDVWTQFSSTLSGLSGPTAGRFAFRYYVTNAGLQGRNADYIGIDSVSYSAVPEPTSMLLLATIGAGVFVIRCRRFCKK